MKGTPRLLSCAAALALLAFPVVTPAAQPSADAPRGEKLALGTGYAVVARLAHQRSPGENGALLLVFEEDGMKGVPLYESRDDGRHWQLRMHVTDAPHASDPHWQLRWQPNLIELARASGPLPSGALLLSGNATRSDERGRVVEEHLQVYASTDAGRTWRYLSDIVDGGGRPEDTDNRGVWEPNLRVLPDGTLIAYYSSEQHKNEGFNQLLAHKTSVDGGRHWSEEHIDVAHPGEVERPGMAVVEPIRDGRFVMSYEDIDGPRNGQVFLKFSRDGRDWGDPAARGTPVRTASGGWPAASPIVRWIDDGSRQGILVVLAERGGGTGDPDGRTLYWNAEGGRGWWWQAPAPVRKLTGNIHAGWTQAFLPTRDKSGYLHVTSSSSPAAPAHAGTNVILYGRAPEAFDTFEAEDAQRRDAVQIGSPEASSGSKLRIAVGGAATFAVALRCPGTGRVVLRYADVDRNAIPQLELDGNKITARGTLSADRNGWLRFAIAIPVLSSGSHQIVVSAPTHAFDIDLIELPLACPGPNNVR